MSIQFLLLLVVFTHVCLVSGHSSRTDGICRRDNKEPCKTRQLKLLGNGTHDILDEIIRCRCLNDFNCIAADVDDYRRILSVFPSQDPVMNDPDLFLQLFFCDRINRTNICRARDEIALKLTRTRDWTDYELSDCRCRLNDDMYLSEVVHNNPSIPDFLVQYKYECKHKVPCRRFDTTVCKTYNQNSIRYRCLCEGNMTCSTPPGNITSTPYNGTCVLNSPVTTSRTTTITSGRATTTTTTSRGRTTTTRGRTTTNRGRSTTNRGRTTTTRGRTTTTRGRTTTRRTRGRTTKPRGRTTTPRRRATTTTRRPRNRDGRAIDYY